MRPTRLTLGELANLWVDEPDAPFHIALATEFDGTPFLRADGSVDLERVREELVHRAHRVPALRRKVVWTRPGHGRPNWAEDPMFDAARHISTTSVPDGQAFHDWCAGAILRPLDRGRPLWQIQVVGLPDARFGMLIVVHHVVAGGLAGIALAATLLDTVPDAAHHHLGPESVAADSPTPRPAGPEPGQGVLTNLRSRCRQATEAAADLRTRAPVTSLSGRVGPGRRLATVRMPLADLREAGHQLGVSINDLLLAAVTGGLRELLAARGENVSGLVLRASVPVGARAAGQPDGMLLVSLPVGEPDPLRRLAIIHESTAVLKSRLRAGGGDVLDVLQLPLPAAHLAVRWMRRIAGGRINLFLTNVPGPERPLWLAGARLLSAVPVAPLSSRVPLGIAALSYDGNMFVSANADAAVHDLDLLAAGLQRSVLLLAEAARAGTGLPAVQADDPTKIRGAIENAVEIERDAADVFAFITDPRHERDWNRQLLELEQLTNGPIGVGTRFRMRFGHGVGDSTVTYVEYDPPRRWAATSIARRLEVRLDGTVQPTDAGARLGLRTRLRPPGLLRPLTPLLNRYMRRTWKRNLAVIKAQLENQEKGQPDASRSRLRKPLRQHP